MGKIKTVALPAASLVEVTVSMVIMLLVFALGFTIYVRLTSSGRTLSQLRYRLQAVEIANQTKRTRSYLDEQSEKDELLFRKKVSYYENNNRLLLLEVQVIDQQDSIVAYHRELIYDDKETR